MIADLITRGYRAVFSVHQRRDVDDRATAKVKHATGNKIELPGRPGSFFQIQRIFKNLTLAFSRWYCRLNWTVHGVQTYENRLARGTQKLLTVCELLASILGACLLFSVMQLPLATLLLYVGQSPVLTLSIEALSEIHVVVSGFVFAVGYFASNVLFIQATRFLFPFGTGRGMARLDRFYLSTVKQINQGKIMLSDPAPDIESLITKVTNKLGLVESPFRLKQQLLALECNHSDSSRPLQSWLLDNMINSIRDFKILTKYHHHAAHVNVSYHASLIALHKDLVNLVDYLKDRQGMQFSDFSDIMQIYDRLVSLIKNNCFNVCYPEVSSTSKCTLGLAFESLLEIERVAASAASCPRPNQVSSKQLHNTRTHSCGHGSCADELCGSGSCTDELCASGLYARGFSERVPGKDSVPIGEILCGECS